jgi:hypothetical protein
MKKTFFFLFTKQILAQFKSQISTCYNTKNHYFCNHGNKSVAPKKSPYQTYGWCCPNDSEEGVCEANEKKRGDVRCTPVRKPGLALYMSYWPEMKSRYCGESEREIVATAEL